MAPISFSELPPRQNHPEKTTVNGRSIPLQHKSPPPDSSEIITNVPVVALDVNILTDTIAARLATSLLGHVLFLKNQIPLPIVQLSRLPAKQGSSKAAKLKADLLSAFDTLTSHFITSFSALSTALAQIKTPGESASPITSRVYLAILVGPSLGTARSKVFYGVDKFQTSVWGSIDESKQHTEVEEDEESGDEYPEDSEDEATGEEDDSEVDSKGSETDGTDEEQGFKDGEESGHTGNGDEGNDDDKDDEKQENTVENHQFYSPISHESYAEEQRFLQTADRLLARTLAAADANGHGIANEMSPTQTHILLRAPRRFNHPAWIPRQNLTKQMENALTEFLDETSSLNTSTGRARKKQPVEGVWITGREGLRDIETSQEHLPAREGDDMIWWSWDGKLVGFADW